MTVLDPSTVKVALAVIGIVALALYAVQSGLLARLRERLKDLYNDLQWKVIAWELKRRGPR